MEKQEKLVLIDGNSLINRAFYALPLLSNSNGEYSNAVYGFCNILIKLIEQEQPKYMAVAFDLGEPTFRHKLFADYKAGRKKMPDELAMQLPILKNVLKSMNIKIFEQPGIEADDLIGSLAKKFSTQTIIVSGDRDLFQLVDDTTSVWFTKRGITETVSVTPKNIKEVYGVLASQVVDLKSLMGDSSDNIKGVAGIGEKTAKTLIEQYGSLDGVYQNIEELKGATKQKLVDGKNDAYLSQTLATINTQVPLDVSLENLQYDFPFGMGVLDIFKKYEIFSIAKRTELFSEESVQTQKKSVSKNNIKTQADFDALIKNLQTTGEFSICLCQNTLHIANSKYQENIVFIKETLLDEGIYSQYVFENIAPLLKNESIKKIFLNAKEFMHQVPNVEIKNIGFDANLALYLLSGSRKTEFSAEQYTEKFDYEANCISACLFATKSQLLSDIEAEGMLKLYFDVELPLVSVLFDMEQSGFKIDVSALHEMGVYYEQEIQALTKKIYQDVGTEFNIKSPKQLGEILFDKLKLVPPRNMKKSTSVDVLERIASQHQVIEKILRFRKIEKLYNTYIEPFQKLADKNGFIHTIFNQTLTATGRLSSSEPNLQNIPIRDDEGKNLRKIFVPREPNGVLIASDYSQIELRLLAHYSMDPKLVDAYNKDIDIHSQTASDIFGVKLEDVTPQMRRDAKSVNFGIIYGISDYGLAQNIMTSRQNAKLFIDRYFETYSHVKKYMENMVELAKNTGFVTTMCGRKRKIDELNSPDRTTRMFGERAAMNMPLQGTASDIIKIAMVNVYNEIKSQNLKSKLILQIHDELIVDTYPGEEEKVKQILKAQMENACKLNVPLVAQISSGKTWFDAK